MKIILENEIKDFSDMEYIATLFPKYDLRKGTKKWVFQKDKEGNLYVREEFTTLKKVTKEEILGMVAENGDIYDYESVKESLEITEEEEEEENE